MFHHVEDKAKVFQFCDFRPFGLNKYNKDNIFLTKFNKLNCGDDNETLMPFAQQTNCKSIFSFNKLTNGSFSLFQCLIT